MGDTHIDHGPIPTAIIDSIPKRLPLSQARKVFGIDLFRFPLRPPRATRVFKGSHQLFLFGVHRKHRVAGSQQCFHLSINIPELSVPIGVLRTFLRLTIGLQGIPISSTQRATVTHVTGCPNRVNSSAMFRVDLLVHRNTLIGSPAVVSSRIFLNNSRTVGSTCSIFFLPPPPCRTRFSPRLSNFRLPRNSSTALVIFVRDNPVNADIRLMPPRPRSSALSAANNLA